MSFTAAIIGGIAAGGTGAAVGSLMADGGGGGYAGGGVVEMPQYSFTEPRLKQTSDFLSQNIQRLNEGKYPTYYDEGSINTMRQGMQRGVRDWAYGTPLGGPGALQEAEALGARQGIGPKAAQARQNKVLEEYARKEQEIDEYLAKLGFQAKMDAGYKIPMLSLQMPKGPNSRAMQGVQMPESPNYLGDAMGDIAGSMPWEEWADRWFNRGSSPDMTSLGGAYDYHYQGDGRYAPITVSGGTGYGSGSYTPLSISGPTPTYSGGGSGYGGSSYQPLTIEGPTFGP